MKTLREFLLLIAVFGWWPVFAQQDALAISIADTVNFSVNVESQWSLFNSFIELKEGDTVKIEIVIGHKNPFNWETESFVGRIKLLEAYPSVVKIIPVELIDRLFQLRIDETGNCFVRQVSGPTPLGEQFVLPVHAIYRK